MSNKAIFLDRDDTLIEDPGYINDPDQVVLLDGAAKALIELRNMGYKLIVVSNQAAVAHGIVTEKLLGQIHDRLNQLLAEKNAPLDRIYYCPYHPEGAVQKYRKESNSRKPNPGMLLTAADEMDIDLARSWVIGNSGSDVQAGQRAGCKTILITHPSHYKHSESAHAEPDYKAINITEAVNIVKKYHRSPHNAPTTVDSTPQSTTQSEPPTLPQNIEHAPAPEPASTEQIASDDREHLLNSILEQLKTMQRTDMFDEFSVMRLMAGVVQIVALFCLVATIWFLMRPNANDNSVFIALGFAVVLQVMSLTFYMMQGRK